MDLMQENPMQEKKVTKVKLSFVIVIVLIIILLIAAAVIWLYSQKLKNELFKVNIDGLANAKARNQDGLFLIEDGEVYTSISDICSYIGYTYYPGGYGQYSEDRTKCYVNNSKEIVSFSSGSNEIVKYPSNDGQSQTFEIDKDILPRGEKLYISASGLERAFNLSLTYSSESNTLNIFTLPYLTNYYETNIPGASLEKSKFSDMVKFNNEKALLNNLIVIQDENTELYGVASLDSAGVLTTVISTRYNQVEYMEGTSDFIITTEDKKVGIIGSDGMTKVQPDYDSIDVIDKNAGLYLVSSNSKQGVINSNGKIIIHQDYDSIGLDQGSYEDPNVTNRYLLFGNCIPVKLNEKWGLIDINGKTIAPIQYDGIGCRTVRDTGIRNTNRIVIIPEIKGIVIKVDMLGEDGRTIVEKYGIISSTGKPMINIVLDEAYMTTVSDVTTYYVTYQNESIDIVSWWLERVAEETKNTGKNVNPGENTNEVTNEVGNDLVSGIADENTVENTNDNTDQNNEENNQEDTNDQAQNDNGEENSQTEVNN